MNKEYKTVITLLRIAIIGKPDKIEEGVDWPMVMQIASNQGVLGVTFDALEILKQSSFSSQLSTLSLDDLMEWLGQTSYMETQYEQYVEGIRDLASFLGQQNLMVLLMKGYGCSLNYPVPKHRPCGDIDIWLFGKQKEADEQIQSKGIEINYDNDHHSVFSFEGFTVENHQTIMDANSHKSNGYINSLLEKLAMDSLELKVDSLEVRDGSLENVYLPSVKFNSIHLLRHMASDFATVKTTLRHVLDWATFVSKNEVDWAFVHDVAHKAKMNRFLDAINGICVEYLGYSSKIFPIENNDIVLRDRVLKEILTCEDTVDSPIGKMSFAKKVRYGFRKTARMWRNRWKYNIVYDESLLDAFIWKARNRW